VRRIEYGGLGTIASRVLCADLENKRIPNLAWVLEPFVDCTRDLVRVSGDPAVLTPSDSGALVQRYLLDHAP
jgi:hypothetical protein